MSIFKKSAKPFVKLFAVAVIGGSALTGCIQKAEKQHREPVQVIQEVSIPAKQKDEIESFLAAINQGDIRYIDQVKMMVSQATQHLEDTNNQQVKQLLGNVVKTGNQLLRFDKKITSIQDDLTAVHHGHASAAYVSHQIIPKIQDLTDSYNGNASFLSAVVNNVKILEMAGFEFPLFRNQLVDLQRSIDSKELHSGFEKMEDGDQVFEYYHEEAKTLQGIISRSLDKL